MTFIHKRNETMGTTCDNHDLTGQTLRFVQAHYSNVVYFFWNRWLRDAGFNQIKKIYTRLKSG